MSYTETDFSGYPIALPTMKLFGGNCNEKVLTMLDDETDFAGYNLATVVKVNDVYVRLSRNNFAMIIDAIEADLPVRMAIYDGVFKYVDVVGEFRNAELFKAVDKRFRQYKQKIADCNFEEYVIHGKTWPSIKFTLDEIYAQ